MHIKKTQCSDALALQLPSQHNIDCQSDRLNANGWMRIAFDSAETPTPQKELKSQTSHEEQEA
eukprot:5743650-Amphidinium_carterae.1